MSSIVTNLSFNCEIMTWQLNQYRRNLSKPGETKRFLLPWGGVVCQNCDDEGELVHYKSVKEYRDAEKSLWLHLSLMLFRENVSFVHCIHCLLLHCIDSPLKVIPRSSQVIPVIPRSSQAILSSSQVIPKSS